MKRVTLGLSWAKQPFPSSEARDEVRPSQTAPQRWKERGGLCPVCAGGGAGGNLSLRPSYRCSSADAHNPGADFQPTHPQMSGCILTPFSPEQPALPKTAGKIPQGSGGDRETGCPRAGPPRASAAQPSHPAQPG